MSRRDAGAARQGARHARDRLNSTLGGPPGLLTDGGGKPFEYDGGAHPTVPGTGSGAVDQALAGTGKTGPALRWRVGLRVALLISTLAVLGGAWFWGQVAAGQPEVMPLSDVSMQGTEPGGDMTQGAEPRGADAQGAGPGDQPPGSTAAGLVVVHVAGAIAAPGVIQLPAGSRVHQAITAAGGGTPSADLDGLNLAAVLTDGQKLHVPQTGEDLPASSDSAGAAAAGENGGKPPAAGGKVNLNTASVEELDALPKVGPVLAQRIVDWRKEHGLFKAVEELDAVDGVGPKMLETLLPLVGI